MRSRSLLLELRSGRRLSHWAALQARPRRLPVLARWRAVIVLARRPYRSIAPLTRAMPQSVPSFLARCAHLVVHRTKRNGLSGSAPSSNDSASTTTPSSAVDRRSRYLNPDRADV